MATQYYDLPSLTQVITEHYTDFTKETLLEKQPVRNWPQQLGNKAADVINKRYDGRQDIVDVLIVYGGVGRSTLEILKGCQSLSVTHSDSNAAQLEVFEKLLRETHLDWYQQIEGKIVEKMNFNLQSSPEFFLKLKNNSVTVQQMDYFDWSTNTQQYDVIVGDFRRKDIASELHHITGALKLNGLLVLGSIDNTHDGESHYSDKHALTVLKRFFNCIQGVEEFPHIYNETVNKHQFAISYFSVWEKNAVSSSLEGSFQNEQIPSSSAVSSTAVYYDDQHILTSYEKFHYGDDLLSVKNFPLRMSEVILEACEKFRCDKNTMLDAGCGPGRTAIQLAYVFGKVEAYDYSQGFIDLLVKKKQEKSITNLTCYQGDSHRQKEICQEKMFDVIFGCNLIDRLHTPQSWVKQSKEMLNPGGLLVISSPYTWKAEHTSPEKWIGGFRRNGEDVFTVDGLKELLAPDLVLLEEIKVPFVIPDADGTYQYTYSNCTVFGQLRT